ncbi:hypothetical protein D3C86_2135080 [compost metagenome]
MPPHGQPHTAEPLLDRLEGLAEHRVHLGLGCEEAVGVARALCAPEPQLTEETRIVGRLVPERLGRDADA